MNTKLKNNQVVFKAESKVFFGSAKNIIMISILIFSVIFACFSIVVNFVNLNGFNEQNLTREELTENIKESLSYYNNQLAIINGEIPRENIDYPIIIQHEEDIKTGIKLCNFYLDNNTNKYDYFHINGGVSNSNNYSFEIISSIVLDSPSYFVIILTVFASLFAIFNYDSLYGDASKLKLTAQMSRKSVFTGTNRFYLVMLLCVWLAMSLFLVVCALASPLRNVMITLRNESFIIYPLIVLVLIKIVAMLVISLFIYFLTFFICTKIKKVNTCICSVVITILAIYCAQLSRNCAIYDYEITGIPIFGLCMNYSRYSNFVFLILNFILALSVTIFLLVKIRKNYDKASL